jgi:hypothetical protein
MKVLVDVGLNDKMEAGSFCNDVTDLIATKA